MSRAARPWLVVVGPQKSGDTHNRAWASSLISLAHLHVRYTHTGVHRTVRADERTKSNWPPRTSHQTAIGNPLRPPAHVRQLGGGLPAGAACHHRAGVRAAVRGPPRRRLHHRPRPRVTYYPGKSRWHEASVRGGFLGLAGCTTVTHAPRHRGCIVRAADQTKSTWPPLNSH